MNYKFLDVCNDVTKTATKILQKDYLSTGKYPIFDQGKEYIGGYYNDDELAVFNYPYIIFGDHTRVIKYVDGPCYIGADGVKLLKVVNKNFLTKYVYYSMIANPVVSQGYARHFKLIKESFFKYTDINKQKYIINELDKICCSIKNKQKLILFQDELIKSRFIEMFGNIENTKYPLDLIENLSEFVKDGTHQTPTYTNDKENGYKFVSSKDVTTGKIDWDNVKYIPEELHKKLYKTIKPQLNDILLAKNGTTGIGALVDRDIVFDIYVSVALLRFKEGNPIYWLSAINSDDAKKQFNGSLIGVGVPNLHLGKIKKVTLIVPPNKLQNEFADFVKQIDKLKFVDYSKYFLCDIFTLFSSTIAYSSVVSILACPNIFCTCSIGIPLSIAFVANVRRNLCGCIFIFSFLPIFLKAISIPLISNLLNGLNKLTNKAFSLSFLDDRYCLISSFVRASKYTFLCLLPLPITMHSFASKSKSDLLSFTISPTLIPVENKKSIITKSLKQTVF